MKKLRKPVRVALWTLGGVSFALLGLYLLRWPLLGGLVRSKVRELVLEQLKADIEIGELGGSLIRGLEAGKVTLNPRAGSPIGPSSVARLRVSYGLFFSGTPELEVEDARVVLAPPQGPSAPPEKTVRDAVVTLRTLKLPVHGSIRSSELTLPDGTLVKIDQATLDARGVRAEGELKGFGAVRVRLRLDDGGAWRAELRASEGPLSSARISLGAGEKSASLSVEALVEGQQLRWDGTAAFEGGVLARVEGELSVKEGHAKTVVDFTTGRATADVDAVYPLNLELQGDVTIVGHAEGPIAGPLDAWSLRDGLLKTRGAKLRQIPIDEAEVRLGPGGLGALPFKARAASLEDRVEAEGSARWNGKLDLDAALRASAARLTPYLELVPDAPAIRCSKLRVEGKLQVRANVPAFDGTIAGGEGNYELENWEALSFSGAAAPGRLAVRELVVHGSRFAPRIEIAGTLEGRALTLRIRAGDDRVAFDGHLEPGGDYDGKIGIDGPLAWLRAFKIQIPEEYLPIHADGTIARAKDEVRVGLHLHAGDETSFSPVATAKRTGDEWRIAMDAGTISLPGGRKVAYEAFPLVVTPGKAKLDRLPLTFTEAEFVGRFSGSVEWDQKQIRAAFDIAEPSLWKTEIRPLVVRAVVDRASGEISPDVSWGGLEGDRLKISGRVGKELDLQVEIHASDLRNPLIRHFVPVRDLEGSISLDAHLSGTPEHPELNGTLAITKLRAGGAPPLNLLVPLKSENGILRIWAVSENSAYGRLTIDGTVPLPGRDEPINLVLRLATNDFTPLTSRLTPQAQVWIPKGALTAEFSLEGSYAQPRFGGRADFVALSFRPPPPLALVSDLRLSLRFDPTGIDVEMLDGLLGGGPFWATGRWDLLSPGQPLSLWVTGRDALVVEETLTRLRVTPDAILSYDEKNGLKLTGRVEVPLGIWHREFTAATIGPQAPTRTVSAPRLRLVPAESGGFLIPGIEGLEGLQLDLQAKTTGEFRIQNSMVGIILGVEGQLGGTAAEPVLSGMVRSRPQRGEVKLAPGNFLRIDRAEIQLPEAAGRSPAVRFEGHSGIGEGIIYVLVEGPLESPTLTLRSEPPRPQKELLARLAFGQESGALSTETAGATIALYIYGQIQDAWPDPDRKEGFFDKFRPTIIPGEDSQQRRVPWELPPSGNTRTTSLRTEYVWNSYFSIIAETSREGDVGGDLKLRIRF